MSISAVILNYNDGEGTIEAVERIKRFSIFSYIVVVDNCSGDKSAEEIKAYLNKLNASCVSSDEMRYRFIENDKNGGYGYGNNRGIEYSKNVLKCTYAVVANPDSVFDEELIASMSDIFCREKMAAVVGAVMTEEKKQLSYEDFISSAWPIRSSIKYMVYSGPVLKRIFKKSLNYSQEYFEDKRKTTDNGSTYIEAEAVHGSLLMTDTGKFEESGGYDDQVFLYCEEDILASRIKSKGFSSFCVLDNGYYHEGSHSISKNGNNAVRRQKFRQESERYYFKNYLKAGAVKNLVFTLIQRIVLIETWILSKAGFLG